MFFFLSIDLGIADDDGDDEENDEEEEDDRTDPEQNEAHDPGMATSQSTDTHSLETPQRAPNSSSRIQPRSSRASNGNK